MFWQQIQVLPGGVYDKGNQQAAGANQPQVLVTFIDKPVGTVVNIFMNGVRVKSAQVVDVTGLVYTRITLPLSRAQDNILISIREVSNGLTIEEQAFSTSVISYLFEAQSAVLNDTLLNEIQVEQNASIDGVSTDLLEKRYGAYTGLMQRNDQTNSQYRTQTSCLWKAYQYASMEKGASDAIKCVLGQNVVPVISPTRFSLGGKIFDDPQWTTVNPFGVPPHPLTPDDPDTPHFYIADIAVGFRTYPTGYGPAATPQDILGPYPGTWNTDWTSDSAKQLITHTIQALGNEVFVIGVNEADAIIPITGEQINASVKHDQTVNVNIVTAITITGMYVGGVWTVIGLPIESTDFSVNRTLGQITWLGTGLIPDSDTQYTINYGYRAGGAIVNVTGESILRIPMTDQIGNTTIATNVLVTDIYIRGVHYVSPHAHLPVQGADFTVDVTTGIITWINDSDSIPDENTIFKVNYSFRLDDALKIVLKKVKPSHKSIVFRYSNVTSTLPVTMEI